MMTIIRKRLIPFEEVDISSDEVLVYDGSVLITRWLPIKPRPDIDFGISYTSLTNNYKISCFFGEKQTFKYWYCDIISVEYFPNENKYIIKDLLVDIKLIPGHAPEVLDLDEFEVAIENKLITNEEKELVLRTLDQLLNMIDTGKFPPVEFNYELYLPFDQSILRQGGK